MTISLSDWKEELKSLITDPQVLCETLALPLHVVPKAKALAKQFPLRVTPSFVSRIKKNDLQDPLLQQILPVTCEAIPSSEFSKDPLEEAQYNPVPGLLHKYKGRVLITVTGGCAIHCRYCFRRHFPYEQNVPDRQLQAITGYIEGDITIREVILSGGDPLLVPDSHLAKLLQTLETIRHLQFVRIHTRLPVVLPSRITETLIQILQSTRLKVLLVMHCNHPQEIDASVLDALSRLARSGIKVLNQSVLLKGINDSVEVLSQLSYRLLEGDVLPYYLHLLDKVQGSAHFEVPVERAKVLYYELRASVPGYLVPLLVVEKPGHLSKMPAI